MSRSPSPTINVPGAWPDANPEHIPPHVDQVLSLHKRLSQSLSFPCLSRSPFFHSPSSTSLPFPFSLSFPVFAALQASSSQETESTNDSASTFHNFTGNGQCISASKVSLLVTPDRLHKTSTVPLIAYVSEQQQDLSLSDSSTAESSLGDVSACLQSQGLFDDAVTSCAGTPSLASVTSAPLDSPKSIAFASPASSRLSASPGRTVESSVSSPSYEVNPLPFVDSSLPVTANRPERRKLGFDSITEKISADSSQSSNLNGVHVTLPKFETTADATSLRPRSGEMTTQECSPLEVLETCIEQQTSRTSAEQYAAAFRKSQAHEDLNDMIEVDIVQVESTERGLDPQEVGFNSSVSLISIRNIQKEKVTFSQRIKKISKRVKNMFQVPQRDGQIPSNAKSKGTGTGVGITNTVESGSASNLVPRISQHLPTFIASSPISSLHPPQFQCRNPGPSGDIDYSHPLRPHRSEHNDLQDASEAITCQIFSPTEQRLYMRRRPSIHRNSPNFTKKNRRLSLSSIKHTKLD